MGFIYTYEADILPILKTSCNTTGCRHSGSTYRDFTTYAGIKPVLDQGEFNKRVFEISEIPKNKRLSFKKKSMLQCWMGNGFKEK